MNDRGNHGADGQPAEGATMDADDTRSRTPLIEIEDLSVHLPAGRNRLIHAVERVSLTLFEGERVGLVGESGSGKSVTIKAISGLLPESPAVRVEGSIRYRGTELIGASAAEWRMTRSKRISMIFQDPQSYLNPTMRVGRQVMEALRHGRAEKKGTAELHHYLELAGLQDPRQISAMYPFQLSGGMRQRVLIAIALAKEPEAVMADEPTTALDATVQRRVLASLDRSVEELGTSLLLVTHDLGVVAGLCDRIYVMYRGNIVESGTTEQIFYDPQNDYTKELLMSVRSLHDDTPLLHTGRSGPDAN